MPVFFVSVDQGNSRLKLCAWERDGEGLPRIQAQASLDGHGAAEAAGRWVQGLGQQLPCGVVSVASTQAQEELFGVLRSVGDLLLPAHGLEVRCARPESVGLDRLFAARGALAHLGQACVVVDAGTALTVDAVLDQAAGVFLGGAIAPGPVLLARSLAEGAAQLPLVETGPDQPALGGDTQAAIRSGVLHGFRGAARELARCMAHEAGLEQAPVVLTGGARGYLLQPDSVFSGEIHEVPELVHLGLLAASLGAGEAR